MMEPSALSDDLDIKKYWLVLKRRWLPATIVFGLISSLSIVSTLFEEPVYRARGSLLFKSSRAPSLIGLDRNLGELDTLAVGGNPLETQAQLVRSLPVARYIIDNLELKKNNGEPLSPQVLLGSLDVAVSPTADVLQVSYTSPNAETAAAIVNQAMDEYIKTNLRDNRAEAISAREFIESKLPQSKEAVRTAEVALRRFKEANQIVTLRGEADTTVDILKDLDQESLRVQSELVDITTKTAELSAQLGVDPRESFLVTTLQDSPGVKDLVDQLQTVQKELAIERTRYRDDYPAIRALDRQESALNELLQNRVAELVGSETVSIDPGLLKTGELQRSLSETLVNLEVERLALVNQLDHLNRTRNIYQNRAKAFPGLEERQGLIERRLQTALDNYNDLLSRLQEAQIAENQNVGNAQIVQEALVPLTPIASSSQLVWFAGAVCGLLLGLALAFILDILDRSLKTLQETQRLLPYPLLGVIPDENLLSQGNASFEPALEFDAIYDQFPVTRNLYTPLGNAYQTFLNNIKAISAKESSKVVLLTSMSSMEGTSTLAANLAATAAQARRRVLLIDAHLARPNQHVIWKLNNSLGFSDLINQTLDQKPVDWQEMVSPLTAHLSIMPAGQEITSFSSILESDEIKALVRQMAAFYDLVVFDTPPLTDCADAVILGCLVDELVLVVNPKKASVDDLEAVKDLFVRSHQKPLGFVANQVSSDEEESSRHSMALWHITNNSKEFNSRVEPQFEYEGSRV